MIKKLAGLATYFDSVDMYKEADVIDSIMQKLAQFEFEGLEDQEEARRSYEEMRDLEGEAYGEDEEPYVDDEVPECPDCGNASTTIGPDRCRCEEERAEQDTPLGDFYDDMGQGVEDY